MSRTDGGHGRWFPPRKNRLQWPANGWRGIAKLYVMRTEGMTGATGITTKTGGQKIVNTEYIFLGGF